MNKTQSFYRKILNRLISEPNVNGLEINNERERQHWISNILKKIPAGKKILDAGAGECQYKKYCNHLKYVSQDFNQYKPEDSPVGLQMESWKYNNIDIVSDITNIPVKPEHFDYVLCTGSVGTHTQSCFSY